MLKMISVAALSAGVLLADTTANAQLGVDLGADVDLGVDIRVGDPYTYRGYDSGRWYYSDYDRRGRYYDAYGGYDCHKGFKYTWHDDYQARYEAYWCYDDNNRRYEVERTRAVVRVD